MFVYPYSGDVVNLYNVVSSVIKRNSIGKFSYFIQ